MAKDMRSSPLDQLDRVASATGQELVGGSLPNRDDVALTAQQIADLGGGGSGLPSQWTDGGNGDVTAAVDDAAKTPITIEAIAGQTESLLKLVDENAAERGEWFPNGVINQYLSDPAVVGWLLKMAVGQTASPLRITDASDNPIFDFDPVNRVIIINDPTNTTDAHTTWYAQAFDNFSESDLILTVGGVSAIELDTFVSNLDPTQNYTHADLKTQPSQLAGERVIDVANTDSGVHVFTLTADGSVFLRGNIPTADPHVVGQVFSTGYVAGVTAGTLKISAG